MMRKTGKTGLLISFFIGLAVLFPMKAIAQEKNSFVTIVNPVRISSYNKNPGKSIKNEYLVIKKNALPATWLLTYDALGNSEIVSVVKSMNKDQEFGVFLEVTNNFATNAKIEYNDTGFWHHASGVFLSGYPQDQRRVLIDTVFAKFKEVFGFYPVSVGSWWTDSYSLSYMKEKYGITSNLVCSDQFATDGYQIWGQPWAIPYYPSKYHAAVPATNKSVKLDLVNIQWAPRDPLNGYYSSLFSTQDYLISGRNLDTTYFGKLVSLYTNPGKNDFGQITVGLEADLNPDEYGKEFSKQMTLIKRFQIDQGPKIITMKEFSNWYRNKYPDLSPSNYLEAEDLLGSGVKTVWSQSPEFRLFYTTDPKTQEIVVRDLRFYNSNLEEPNYLSPNTNFNLEINIPAVIDEISFRDGIKGFKTGTNNILEKFSREKIDVPLEGVLIKGFSSEAIHFLKQKKAILSLVTGKGWNYFKKVNYLIPQGEVYALDFLKKLPSGMVLVYDNECLQCKYHTEFRPPSFSNVRSYVGKFGKKPVVYNKSVFQAKDRQEAKNELKKTGTKYIYLVKFEGYLEKLPFSPGDLGVEKIFSNANAEIWRVVK